MRTLEKDGIEPQSNKSTTERITNSKTLRVAANMGMAFALVMAGGACKKKLDQPQPVQEKLQKRTESSEADQIKLTQIEYNLENIYDQFLDAYHGKQFKPEVAQELVKMVQEFSQQISESTLTQFKEIPEINTLYNFMKKHVFYSVAIGPRGTVSMAKKSTIIPPKDDLEIVYMPNDFPIPATIMVENQGHTIRIEAGFKHREWLALALTHGLSLSYDYLENPDPTTPLHKEVRAYLKEIKVLKAISPATYNKALEEGVPLMQKTMQQGGTLSNVAGFCQQSYNLQDPEISESERKIGTSVCALAIYYAAILNQDPTQTKLTPAQIQQLIEAMRQIGGQSI